MKLIFFNFFFFLGMEANEDVSMEEQKAVETSENYKWDEGILSKETFDSLKENPFELLVALERSAKEKFFSQKISEIDHGRFCFLILEIISMETNSLFISTTSTFFTN